MTKQDAQSIAAHCQAQVASDQFNPRMEAAYDILRAVPEYQSMAATLLRVHGVNFRSLDDSVTMSARSLATVALTCIACGFAFGEDWGECKALESTLAGKENGR